MSLRDRLEARAATTALAAVTRHCSLDAMANSASRPAVALSGSQDHRDRRPTLPRFVATPQAHRHNDQRLPALKLVSRVMFPAP